MKWTVFILTIYAIDCAKSFHTPGNQIADNPLYRDSRANRKIIESKLIQKLDNFDAQNLNTFNQVKWTNISISQILQQMTI